MAQKGRIKGKPNIGLGQIETIIDLSEKSIEDTSINRRFIAEKAGCSKQTVYNYQKKYNLI